jgi:thioesterase domain-containing protein
LSIAAFLAELRRRDVRVWCEGETLRCNAPQGALTPELRDELRLRKAEVLEFLRAAQAQHNAPRGVVPLNKAGRLTPVFALPGHNGDVFCYRALAQALGKEQPFYGLQPPGVDGASAPLTTVEELAAYFVPQVRAIQPTGPVIIAGFCAGGAVAFELAQQLVAAGARVESVAFFGSPYPAFFGWPTQLRLRTLRRLRGLAQHLLTIAKGKWRHVAQKWRERAAGDATPRDQDPVLQFRAAVEQATLRAVRSYRPRPFKGTLKLFVPSPSWARVNQALRWQSMAMTTEVYYGLEGHTNDTMLLAPQATLYADLYRRAGGESTARVPPRADFGLKIWLPDRGSNLGSAD